MILVFFFNDTATTEIYTLSLHDALPIYPPPTAAAIAHRDWERIDIAGYHFHLGSQLTEVAPFRAALGTLAGLGDRKSTRLNSSHANISYAVFCLKKKKNQSYKCILMYLTHVVVVLLA